MHIIANSDAGKTTIAIFLNLLIKNGGDINAKDEDGVTPLQTAILYKRLDVISFLIEKGAKLDEKDNNGCTALHMAARQLYHRNVITMLIRSGANPYIIDYHGKTFLDLMIESERKYFMDLIHEEECFQMKTPCE